MPRKVVHATILLFTPDSIRTLRHAYLSHSFYILLSLYLYRPLVGAIWPLPAIPSFPPYPLLPSFHLLLPLPLSPSPLPPSPPPSPPPPPPLPPSLPPSLKL